MSEDNGALTPIDPLPPASSQEPMSADQAVAMLDKLRKGEDTEQPAESADDATADTESTSQEDDTAQPDEAATGETQEDTPAEKSQRELPRSWSKDKAEAWAKLDPAVQDYLLEQDSKVSAEVRRAQNEAAEVRKTVEAEKKAVAEERERYLKVATAELDSKEAQIARNFPYIKTMDDVTFLANEAVRLANSGNPDDLAQSQQVQAYIQAWRVAQDDLAVTRAQKVEAERRHQTEHASKWNEFVQSETKAFAESLPAADKAKLDAWNKAAPDFLVAKGFSPEELTALATGKEKLAIHDRRVQSLILDGLKYQELQKAPPRAIKPDLPPVQRPGAKQPSGAAQAQSLQVLDKRLNQSGSLDDAMALLMAQRKAS